jgi:hypothetical protein
VQVGAVELGHPRAGHGREDQHLDAGRLRHEVVEQTRERREHDEEQHAAGLERHVGEVRERAPAAQQRAVQVRDHRVAAAVGGRALLHLRERRGGHHSLAHISSPSELAAIAS